MNYTADDVLAMVADGRLILSNLPSRRLSASQVVIEVNNKTGIDVLTLPDGYEHDGILDTLLHSFTLPGYALRVDIGEKSVRNNAVAAFLRFVDTQRYPTYRLDTLGNSVPTHLPAHCFTDWMSDLKRTNTPYYTWTCMSQLLKILSRTLEKRYGKTANWPQEQKLAWQMLEASTPTKPKHVKAPPLGHYLGVPESKFTNYELKMGLRYGVIWLLKRLEALRAEFIVQPEIADTLSALYGKSQREVESAFQGFDRFRSNGKPRSDRPDNRARLALMWLHFAGHTFTMPKTECGPNESRKSQYLYSRIQSVSC